MKKTSEKLLFFSLLISCISILLVSISIVQAKDVPKFKDYAVNEIYKGPSKIPTFSKETATTREEYIWRFEAQLKEMRDGPDFAGHFFVFEGGCGTGCTFAVVADNKTGKYYKFPDTGLYAYYKYRLNSRLIFEYSQTNWTKGQCMLLVYAMEDKSLKRIYRKNLGAATDENGCDDPDDKTVGKWNISSSDGKTTTLFNRNTAGDELTVECLSQKVDSLELYNQLSRYEKDILASGPHIHINMNKKILPNVEMKNNYNKGQMDQKKSEIKINIDDNGLTLDVDENGMVVEKCEQCLSVVEKLHYGKTATVRFSDGRTATFTLEGAEKAFNDLSCKPYKPPSM